MAKKKKTDVSEGSDVADKQPKSTKKKKIGQLFKKGNDFEFQKGVSGNPKGRPPGRDIRKVFEDLLDVKIKHSKTDRRVLDELVDAILKHAIGGNAAYMRELLDRTYGKVVQQVEVAESHTFVRQTDPERKNNDNDSESGE